MQAVRSRKERERERGKEERWRRKARQTVRGDTDFSQGQKVKTLLSCLRRNLSQNGLSRSYIYIHIYIIFLSLALDKSGEVSRSNTYINIYIHINICMYVCMYIYTC